MKKKHVIPMAVLSSALVMGTVAPSSTLAVSTQTPTEVVQKNVHKANGNKPFFVKEKQAEKQNKADERSAKAFLKKNNAKYKVDAPEESLDAAEVKKDQLGMTHVKLQQKKNGVPVDGHAITVHYSSDNRVQAVSGQFNESVEDSSISTEASLSKEESLKKAKAAVKAPKELPYEPSSELVIYPFDDENHLAYKVNVTFMGEQPGNWFVYVDANSGEVIDQYNAIMHADGYQSSTGAGLGVLGDHRQLHISHQNDKSFKDGTKFYLLDQTHENLDGIYTYDFKNSWAYNQLPGELFQSNDAAFTDDYDRPAVDAHYNSEEVYDYFLEEHDRNSIDGEGMPIISSVHFGEDYNNAFWNGRQMTYGDGDGEFFIPLSAGLDVAAHEMTHGVTTHSAGLKYEFQSGALNEAFSDIFGALVDEEDWEVGEDIMAEEAVASGRESLRSLSNPSKYPVGSAYVEYGDGNGMYPSHMDEYYDLPLDLDNGGVHINSSIINHAAYITGEQIGKEKLGQIYYRALTVYLAPESDFSYAREVLIQSAVDLYGEGSEEALATEDGFNKVGITE
ncbi:M4 family metallopeptidase [Halobacillus mangrovi]|uniref:Neutral metalloproteinase n=1 Tax=Halobacillus mangrovi TaxID=402384 RepID=A0A1W5ZSZ7_9BACI|nr:M4 family metallopeptidase [Halobacillus mangrovi]ARI76377.1 flagellar biosynthesis protein FlgM [Halobacillus mangrovi]